MSIKNCIFRFIFKLLISIIITLVILILIKSSKDFKTKFYQKVYNENLSFSYLNNIYNKYLSNEKVLNKFIKTEAVFKEKTNYNDVSPYFDGVKVNVNENYALPVNKSGIVVFVGEKENYGNTIIIQRIDGVDEWYGNISNTNVKVYDYLKEGSILGEVNNYYYLVYKKDGRNLNYEEYIK